jgi:hypothetical protein
MNAFRRPAEGETQLPPAFELFWDRCRNGRNDLERFPRDDREWRDARNSPATRASR